MQLIKVKLGLVKNNLSHKAELNATLMEHSLLKQYQFDFSQWCYSIVSDTTRSAVNVAEEFSEDAKQVNCTMHELNSSLKYGYGLLENTKTKFARNEDGTYAVNTEGNRYKVTSIITHGGEFLDGKHIINTLQEIANYFGTSQRLERLRTTQKHWNCPEGRPAYSGETRVSSVHKLLSTSLFHYFTMEKFAMENLDKEAQDYQFHVLWCKLSAVDWCTIQEMEGVSVFVAKYASCESQMTYITSSFTEYLRIRAFAFMEADEFKCLEYIKSPKATDTFRAYSLLNSLQRYSKEARTFTANAMKCVDQLRQQLLKRFKPQTKDDAIVVFLDPRTACYAKKMTSNYIEALSFFEDEIKRMETLMLDAGIRDSSKSTGPVNEYNNSDIDIVDEDDDDLINELNPWLQEIEDNTSTVTKWFKTCAEIKWSEFRQENKDKKKVRTIMDLLTYCDPLMWFQTAGEARNPQFKAILTLASIHLSWCNSSSYQESGFSSENNNMNPFQTCMSSDRFGDRTLLHHNRDFIASFLYN